MTRPSPSEVIAGVRAVLKDVVAPELTSDHARQRLTEVRAVLAQVDWDDAGLVLLAGLRARVTALEAVRAWRPDLVVEVPVVPGLTWDELAEQDRRCAAVLVALVDPLADWLRDHPEDEVAADVAEQVRSVL